MAITKTRNSFSVGISDAATGNELTLRDSGTSVNSLTLGDRNPEAGYNHLSETKSGVMNILGHNATASQTVNNTVVATQGSWYSHFIRMYYNDGIAFHTSASTVSDNQVVYDYANTAVTGSSERMRIETNGHIGIGTTDPQNYLDITVGSASPPTHKGHIRLNVGGDNGANGGIEWRTSTYGNGYGWKLTGEDPGGQTPLILYSRENSASWSERVRFLGASQGGGITFNGDTAAANALDDYEEGTWTPATPNGSWTVNEATYVRIGKIVHCRVKLTATSSISSADFTGLPFNVNGQYGSGIVGYQNSESGEVWSVLVQPSNAFNFRVANSQKGISNGAVVIFALTYETST